MMPASRGEKVSILFHIGQLSQGGAERFLFEVCRELDRTRFVVRVLATADTGPHQFYYDPILREGIPIFRGLTTPFNCGRLPLPRGRQALQRWVDSVHVRSLRASLRPIFDAVDVVCPIQIEGYLALQPLLMPEDRVVTFLMSHRVQYSYDPYQALDPRRRYRFVLTDPRQREELPLHRLDQVETVDFPLMMRLDGRNQLTFEPSAPVKVGLFTRLSPEKPIEPFLYCLRSLRERRNVTLHVFGAGDPGQFKKTLDLLGLNAFVVFEGHRKDLQEALVEEGISVAWMLSVNSFVGYASVELASFGLPIVFWNMGQGSRLSVSDETGGAIETFSDVVGLVEYTDALLADVDKQRALGSRLREYVLRTYEIRSHIGSLGDYLRSVAGDIIASR